MTERSGLGHYGTSEAHDRCIASNLTKLRAQFCELNVGKTYVKSYDEGY